MKFACEEIDYWSADSTTFHCKSKPACERTGDLKSHTIYKQEESDY